MDETNRYAVGESRHVDESRLQGDVGAGPRDIGVVGCGGDRRTG